MDGAGLAMEEDTDDHMEDTIVAAENFLIKLFTS